MVLDMTNGLTRTLVAGAGFFGDQYANNVIGRITDIWKTEYAAGTPGGITHDDETVIKITFYIGCIVGMLTFGFVGDLLGRKWAFVTTVLLVGELFTKMNDVTST